MQESELAKITIGEILDMQADRFGEREFIAYADRDVRFTYRQFLARVDVAARGLMAEPAGLDAVLAIDHIARSLALGLLPEIALKSS